MEPLETILMEQFLDNQSSLKIFQDLLIIGNYQSLLEDMLTEMFIIAKISLFQKLANYQLLSKGKKHSIFLFINSQGQELVL